MTLVRALLLASLTACSSYKPPPSVVEAPPTPAITGAPGEGLDHLLARIITGVCVGDDGEELVTQVQSFLGSCLESGRPMTLCQVAACEKLHTAKQRWACPPYKTGI